VAHHRAPLDIHGCQREEWTEIPVPAIVDEDTFARVQQRLEDNRRFASRGSKVPSLLQGLAACAACGYGYYRTSTRTARKKIYYYRCLGSDNYRYEGGRVCGNKPVRADYLDQVVWDHITGLLADPALIRAEIAKRLEQARTSDPVNRQRSQIERALAKAVPVGVRRAAGHGRRVEAGVAPDGGTRSGRLDGRRAAAGRPLLAGGPNLAGDRRRARAAVGRGAAPA
jgi:Recombinase zinc beta ribbon domain